MIYGFDWDGTLVQSFTAEPLPNVAMRLAALPMGAKTFIATNQAGPVFLAVLNDPKYPTVEAVVQNLTAGLAALRWRPDLLLVCCGSGKKGPQWWRAEAAAAAAFDGQLKALFARLRYHTYIEAHYRKPGPGMLLAGRHELGGAGEAIYIGDMASDEQAAGAARMAYVDAAVWRGEV